MRVLFVTDRLHVPDDFSGSVQSTHALMRALCGRHEVQIIASLPRRWRHFLATVVHKVTARRLILEWRDDVNGYEALRGSSWRFVERVQKESRRYRPDVLVLDSTRMLRQLESSGFEPECRIVVVMHDVHFQKEEPRLPYADRISVVANSPYTATVIRRHFGVTSVVIPPLIALAEYVVDRPSPVYATLVSPHKRKGLDLVLDIASKLAGINFQLVEGWPMGKMEIRQLTTRIQDLGNVTFRRSTADMREVYKDTKVLLVPSELETFGRVVIEAQSSGIPALVTDVGALPWVTGEGGRIFSTDSRASEWAAHLNALYADPMMYSEQNRKARANAQRAEFQADSVLQRFEKLFGSE